MQTTIIATAMETIDRGDQILITIIDHLLPASVTIDHIHIASRPHSYSSWGRPAHVEVLRWEGDPTEIADAQHNVETEVHGDESPFFDGAGE